MSSFAGGLAGGVRGRNEEQILLFWLLQLYGWHYHFKKGKTDF